MSIRTILVHLDLQEQTHPRVKAAAALARRYEAHLVGVAPTGWVMMPADSTGMLGAGDYIEAALNALHDQAEQALKKFEAQVSALGLTSFEGRIETEDIATAMTLASRYCDITVVTQTDPGRWTATQQAGMPESVLLQSGRPLLVLPYAGSPVIPADGRILVAWDGGREAARAMHDSLPLLRHAKEVEVVVFDSSDADELRHGPLPGADIGLWLARHGVQVNVRKIDTDVAAGEALLSHAADVDAQLIVAGGYGHSRLRETVLGGVTRTLLRSSPVPVLLSH